MQPIHLAIGFVEGLATASIVLFLYTARPELLLSANRRQQALQKKTFPIVKTFALLTVISGGIFSWLASTNPDGLEWSIFKTSGVEKVAIRKDSMHDSMAALQNRSTILPDYGFARQKKREQVPSATFQGLKKARLETTAAGLLGAGLCLLFTTLISFLFRLRKDNS